MGHTLSDNRHGLIANTRVKRADGYAEREAAKVMIADGGTGGSTDAGGGQGLRRGRVHPLPGERAARSAEHLWPTLGGPDEIAASKGYVLSQRKRKLIEQGFGWAKAVGRIRQAMVRGLEKVNQLFMLNMAAYNLVRIRTLGQVRPPLGTSPYRGPTSPSPPLARAPAATGINQRPASRTALPVFSSLLGSPVQISIGAGEIILVTTWCTPSTRALRTALEYFRSTIII